MYNFEQIVVNVAFVDYLGRIIQLYLSKFSPMLLNCHSYYSLRYGTLSPKKLVQYAANKGWRSLVLTDINCTSGAIAFIEACKAVAIKPILGIEFRSDEQGIAHTNSQAASFRYVGIAKNPEGFRELCAILTTSSLEKKPLPHIPPPSKNIYYIYRKLVKPIEEFTENEFLGIRPEEINRLHNSNLRHFQRHLVVFSPVTIGNPDQYKAHRILRCIDLNIIISKLEGENCCKSTEVLPEPNELELSFQAFPEIVENSQRILAHCEIDLPSTYKNNRKSYTGTKEADYQLLCQLAVEGCFERYGKSNNKALDRTLKELKIINELGFSSYILITWDIIRYARSQNFHHIGRGSGANSIVAYNLGITDVDPLELDLYFERFINPHRSSPPDFDLDFSWDERDQVIEYVFQKYGREHTALLATFNTFKGKSIIRELGKVLGLPKKDIDLIVNQPLATDKHHPYAKYIFKYGKMIEGFPNYLSIHAGGIVIGEKPLNNFTALQLMPKGYPITHFDMYGAEDLQFHKFDVLSQRGLGHIKDAVQLIQKNTGVSVPIRNVSLIKKNRKVRNQLKSGYCIGCFYIESPAMRGLLTKLKCDNYIHLIAASSIIRPGVAKSGMMREYIRRFHDPKSYQHIHPVFEEHLQETYGVMVYQEDVMKIVHHFSGLGLDESDVLRRIMTGKKKSSKTFARLKEKYFTNCYKKGYSKALAHEVWRQIESFSGYSFCKAHSASFAVESFQSLYLKAYYPLEFMVAVINNFGGFYSTELYVREAMKLGGNVQPPCVNKSDFLTNIEGATIHLGFVHIADLEKKLAHEIVLERERNGSFLSFTNFIQRVDIDRSQLELLIRIGAFRFTGMNKYELMWEKNAVHNPTLKRNGSGRFFEEEVQQLQLPILDEGRHEQSFDEMELLGFPLCPPFALLETDFRGDVRATDMINHVGKTINMVGYFVIRKNVTTSNRKLMNFGTWLDCEGNFFDTIHFPPCLAEYPFKGKGCYVIRGTVVEDFGFPSLEVEKMDILPFVRDPRF